MTACQIVQLCLLIIFSYGRHRGRAKRSTNGISTSIEYQNPLAEALEEIAKEKEDCADEIEIKVEHKAKMSKAEVGEEEIPSTSK